jgi:predicted unusual protein kinase regulating ubiquinone biosynthesis (AarF/ABC1/UbiB family)
MRHHQFAHLHALLLMCGAVSRRPALQCTLRQLLEHGYFHADPHPGNLLATSDGKLTYLDFGM